VSRTRDARRGAWAYVGPRPKLPLRAKQEVQGIASERRAVRRVTFSCDYTAGIMSIDGTWHRACHIADVSKAGARLLVLGSFPTVAFSEFFLMLSASGKAHRSCERIWMRGGQVGVRFLTEHSSVNWPSA